MDERPLVSIFASAYRTWLWRDLLRSLGKTTIPFEVVFCGPNEPDFTDKNLKFILCKNKTAECYERARRACTGEIVHWTADDAEYQGDCIGVGYRMAKDYGRKSVISMVTVENGSRNTMSTHRFFAGFNDSPLMAPLGFMHRDYLEELGGLDSRYEYGQWENDIVMRVMADGGRVEICDNGGIEIKLDHDGKHENKTRLLEAFSVGRKVLEGSWMRDGKITLERTDQFCPFQL